jgi:alpha-glucosidase
VARVAPVVEGDALRFATREAAVLVGPEGSVEVSRNHGRSGSGAEDPVEPPDDWRVVRREAPPVRTGEQWTVTVALEPDDRVHGLGERAAPFDLRPGTYGLWNTEQSGSYGPEADPLYLTVPVCLVVAPGRAHLAFWENSHKGEVEIGDRITARFDGGALRTYVAVGPPQTALARYLHLTGRPEPPPRWALGYHQSRWGYRTEADIREAVAGFRQHDLPLSAIHFDIDYMDRYRVFTVDELRFPDLSGLIADLEVEGVKAVTILDPGVAKAEDFLLYRQGREQGRFLRLPDGVEVNGVVWPGLVAFPDFSDPAVRAWWGDQYPALLDQGVAGIWHDMCEPAVFAGWGDPALPLATRHDLEGRGGDHVEGRNLYGLGMARSGHEALRRHRPDRRPWLLTRSGWAGVQRYAWTWTGDVATSWTMLRRTLATALNLSLSGVPYTGPDIGGFSGDPSPELYTRWFQLAAWLPFFRSHAIFTMPSREPWKACGPHLEAIREAMAWRYRLLPYLYTRAALDDLIIRPVWWPDGDDPALLRVDDAFLCGPDVLVAPVFEEGATRRVVRLPPGAWWDLAGEGSRTGVVEVDVTIDRLPVFVRAGAVLPVDGAGRDVLHLFPPDAAPGESAWFRDAGDGYGPVRIEHLRSEASTGGWTVWREAEDDSYQVDDADLAVAVQGGPWTVAADGGPAQLAEAGAVVRVGDFTELVVRRPD